MCQFFPESLIVLGKTSAENEKSGSYIEGMKTPLIIAIAVVGVLGTSTIAVAVTADPPLVPEPGTSSNVQEVTTASTNPSGTPTTDPTVAPDPTATTDPTADPTDDPSLSRDEDGDDKEGVEFEAEDEQGEDVDSDDQTPEVVPLTDPTVNPAGIPTWIHAGHGADSD